ncbi:hypothetical protein AHAS_Ahas03G0113100 [Arachis hypogaea]
MMPIMDAWRLSMTEYTRSEKVEYKKLSEEQKEITDSFKCATLASLTKSVIDMSVEGEENQVKFKRTFVVFVQKCFLLPTTISMVSPIHKPPALHVDTIQRWDWTSHVLSFLRKGIKAQREGKKLSVDGCIFVLMLIYLHESKFPRLEADNALKPPCVAYWTWRKLIDRIALETTNQMGLVNRAELRGKEIKEKKAYKELSAKQMDQEPPHNVSPRPRHWKDDAPSFNFGISLSTSQTSPPISQPTVTQLKMLADMVMDAGVIATLKFAERTSAGPILSTLKGYMTLEKEKEITKELRKKLRLEGTGLHFMSLTPGQDVKNTAVNTMCILLNEIKCRRFKDEVYYVPIDIVLFVPVCHGGHWWLWIADVKKKRFYVFDPIKKKKNEIPQSRITLNKIVTIIKRKSNKIYGLFISDGSWAMNPEVLQSMVPSPVLSQEACDCLTQPVSFLKVKQVIDSTGSLKAPSPDDFKNGIVKYADHARVRESTGQNHLLALCNTTVYTRLPNFQKANMLQKFSFPT